MKDKSCEVLDCGKTSLYSHVTLIFVTSLNSKFQKTNVSHNLSTHDLSVNSINKAQGHFSYKKDPYIEDIYILLSSNADDFHTVGDCDCLNTIF